MNTQNPIQIIVDILTIIGYNEDKMEFAKDFIALNLQEALMELLDTLTSEQKESFKAKFSEGEAKSPEQTAELLKQFVAPDAYDQMISKVTEKNFKSYIDEIYDTLSEEQKTQLNAYFTEFMNAPKE